MSSRLTTLREAIQERLHTATVGREIQGKTYPNGMLFEGGVLTGPVDRTPRGSVFVRSTERFENAYERLVNITVRAFYPEPGESRDPEAPLDPTELEELHDDLVAYIGAFQNDVSLEISHIEWQSGLIDDETWGVELVFTAWMENNFGTGI